jgi:hypothetical protein
MDENGGLPLELALSSVLTARLDGSARPALLAAVQRVPAQRRPAEDGREPRMLGAQDRRS